MNCTVENAIHMKSMTQTHNDDANALAIVRRGFTQILLQTKNENTAEDTRFHNEASFKISDHFHNGNNLTLKAS